MKFYIIIPAHNEEKVLKKTLISLCNQTLLPEKIVVVNDNSSDKTPNIVADLAEHHDFIHLVTISSSNKHLPGSKVINAFYEGLKSLDEDYDIICKFDADLIFPSNYLEAIKNLFNSDAKIGMASGILYIKQGDHWQYERIADQDHIRGPIKAYRKDCFNDIGGLKRSIGWDTLDVLLSQYHGWETVTNTKLIVKHLKPTGQNYHSDSKYLQGMAMYKMRYGFIITMVAALKLAILKKDLRLIYTYLKGYIKAKKQQQPFLVSLEEGAFIRSLRWKKIRKKLF